MFSHSSTCIHIHTQNQWQRDPCSEVRPCWRELLLHKGTTYILHFGLFFSFLSLPPLFHHLVGCQALNLQKRHVSLYHALWFINSKSVWHSSFLQHVRHEAKVAKWSHAPPFLYWFFWFFCFCSLRYICKVSNRPIIMFSHLDLLIFTCNFYIAIKPLYILKSEIVYIMINVYILSEWRASKGIFFSSNSKGARSWFCKTNCQHLVLNVVFTDYEKECEQNKIKTCTDMCN